MLEFVDTGLRGERQVLEKMDNEHRASIKNTNASFDSKKVKILETEESKAIYGAGIVYDGTIKNPWQCLNRKEMGYGDIL